MTLIKKVFAIFLLLSSLLTFTGCPTALQTVDGADFKSESMAGIFGDIFNKSPENITEAELAAIIELGIVTYSETNQLSVMFKGYYEAKEKGLDTSKYVRTADITGKSLSDMRDMSFLTSLKSFSCTYTSFADFNFLSDCKALERIDILYNYSVKDFSVLEKLPNLKSVSAEGTEITDYSVFGRLKNLENLYLGGTYSGVDGDFDLSFLSGLVNLKSLSLISMGVSDVEPILSLSNLQKLDLNRNRIEDISPLSKLENLKYLNLDQNLISDVSSLTTFHPESFERIILDGNSLIEDWSALDYLGDKVQGRPIMIESADLARIYGTDGGRVKKSMLENVESAEIIKTGDEYQLTLGFTGYLEAYASLDQVPENLYKTIVLTEPVEQFCDHFDGFVNLVAFISDGVSYNDFEFLNKTKLTLSIFEVVGNKTDADYSKLSEMKKLIFVSVKDSVISDKDFFYSLESVDQLIID